MTFLMILNSILTSTITDFSYCSSRKLLLLFEIDNITHYRAMFSIYHSLDNANNNANKEDETSICKWHTGSR